MFPLYRFELTAYVWATVRLIVLQKFNLGDPTDPSVDLGPVISLASAKRIRKQIADAGTYNIYAPYRNLTQLLHLVAAGAKALIQEDLFPVAKACVRRPLDTLRA